MDFYIGAVAGFCIALFAGLVINVAQCTGRRRPPTPPTEVA